MAKSCNGLLCYGNSITYCALLTLGKTCFGTSGSLSLESLLAMAKGCNGLLLYKNFFTILALFTFGKTCSSTGSSYCGKNLSVRVTAGCITNEVTSRVVAGCVIFIGITVTCCGNGALTYGNSITYRALLTLGKTCFGTGGSLSLESLLAMAKSCDRFLLLKDLATILALLALCKTALSTSGIHGSKDLGVRVLTLGFANEVTSLIITGCIVVICKAVACCRNGFLSNEDGTAG